MKVVIEFYRLRARDNMHAIVGRETRKVIDLQEAVVAQALLMIIDMPQLPDSFSITDTNRNRLYSAWLRVNNSSKRRTAT